MGVIFLTASFCPGHSQHQRVSANLWHGEGQGLLDCSFCSWVSKCRCLMDSSPLQIVLHDSRLGSSLCSEIVSKVFLSQTVSKHVSVWGRHGPPDRLGGCVVSPRLVPFASGLLCHDSPWTWLGLLSFSVLRLFSLTESLLLSLPTEFGY